MDKQRHATVCMAKKKIVFIVHVKSLCHKSPEPYKKFAKFALSNIEKVSCLNY